MNSGIVIYPRNISSAEAIFLLLSKINCDAVYSNNKDIQNKLYNVKKYPVLNNKIVVLDDINNVKPNLQIDKLFIMASWGITDEQLKRVINYYPNLNIYKLDEIKNILPLYICKHNNNQLNNCMAKYSHTKQLACGKIDYNSIIDGFIINNIEDFDKRKKGLYVAKDQPITVLNIEHLHIFNNVTIDNIKQWLSKLYLRSTHIAGVTEQMTLHIYGDNLNLLIEEINRLDYSYGEIWKKAISI